MAFKMKGFSGFGNSPMKNEDITATRPMTEDERKRAKAKDRKSTRLNSSHSQQSRMPSSA